jgi:hypothetical protein
MSHDYVEIEHQVIRDGFNELFTFTEICSDKILHWGEEISTEEEEETEQPIEEPISEEEAIMNVSLSFSK